jgi:hypothetical protein
MKQKTLAGMADFEVPSWTVLPRTALSPVGEANLEGSELDALRVEVDEWTSDASNHALRYATHGLFRYFGKFPPLVARYLIESYTKPGDIVFDPMIGCGTTAVEALLLGRHCTGVDVSPLATLLTRVKCRRPSRKAAEHLDAVLEQAGRLHASGHPDPAKWPGSIKTQHWFLPETCHWLWAIRESISTVKNESDRDLLYVAFASIVRRVSRATTQQGRLFLDVDTAVADPRDRFQDAAKEAILRASALEVNDFRLSLHEAACTAVQCSGMKAPLVICHPPYFNLYRYSSINSLECAWLGHDPRHIRKNEIREFFKVGKAANVSAYVCDMAEALRHAKDALSAKGTLALMVGDTVIHGIRIPTTKMLVEAVKDVLEPVRVSIRTPKFTEASWAASQRRTGSKVGISLADFIVHFRKR